MNKEKIRTHDCPNREMVEEMISLLTNIRDGIKEVREVLKTMEEKMIKLY
jgi:hypothetical protein